MKDTVECAFELAVEEFKMGRRTIILFPCGQYFRSQVDRRGKPPEGVWVGYSTHKSNSLKGVSVDTLIQVEPFHPKWDYWGAQSVLDVLRTSTKPKVIRLFCDIENETLMGAAIWGCDPNRIDPVLTKLAEVWKRHPHLRLGQLLFNCAGTGTVFNLEDGKLLGALNANEWNQ